MQWATEAAKYGVMAQSGECIACIVVVLFWWGGGVRGMGWGERESLPLVYACLGNLPKAFSGRCCRVYKAHVWW